VVLDYKKLGLKAGIEVHQQLATKHKLFCNCSAAFRDKKPVFEIKRKLRPVAGELGEIDVAAAFEALKNKTFRYKVYLNESCAVELDSEPPGPINKEALDITLQVALMLNCEVPEEIEVMRKNVLDGSATSSFQRTALAGLNGWIETSFGKVGITNVCLEEDACQILKKDKKSVIYGLNRLGIPLVEIGTSPDIHEPEQAREVAEKIGMVLRSTGRVRRGIGTIRQDLNVSIAKGARCEIKGVQKLNLLSKIVELEVKRQKGLTGKRKKVTRDVRRALPNGRTEFMRPLPGAARLYPETDSPPVEITQKRLAEMRKNLPEMLEKKLGKYVKQFGLNEEMAGQIVSSGKAELFEKLARVSGARLVANVLTKYSREYKISDEKFMEFFKALGRKAPPKEALRKMLKQLSEGKKVSEVLKSAETISEKELRNIIREIIKKNPQALKAPRPEKALMGLVMKEIRGRAPGSLVMKILTEEIKK
jgi:Glu-tRNA(Gln) amidotransferase subunit E-like FAD-binding protein